MFFSTQKTNNERLKEFLSKDRKKLKNLSKSSCFSLEEDDIKKIVLSQKLDGELEKWGDSLLDNCMIFNKPELFNFILGIGENINLDLISIKSIKYGFLKKFLQKLEKDK